MKYLLDTNVVSEVMRADGHAAVLEWVEENQDFSFISALTVAEIEKGVEQLPNGRRKQSLQEAFQQFLPIFEDRVLSFDLGVARVWAKLAAELRRQGRQTPMIDSMIEATAIQWDLTIATRDTPDFLQAATLNPWPAQG